MQQYATARPIRSTSKYASAQAEKKATLPRINLHISINGIPYQKYTIQPNVGDSMMHIGHHLTSNINNHQQELHDIVGQLNDILARNPHLQSLDASRKSLNATSLSSNAQIRTTSQRRQSSSRNRVPNLQTSFQR